MQPNIYSNIKPAEERYNSSLVRATTIHRRFGSTLPFSGLISGGLVPFFSTLGAPILGQWFTANPDETNPGALMDYLATTNNASEGGNARQPQGSSFTLRHGAIRAPGAGRYNEVSALLVVMDGDYVWANRDVTVKRDFSKCSIIAMELSDKSWFGVQANFNDYQTDALRSFGLHIEISTSTGG